MFVEGLDRGAPVTAPDSGVTAVLLQLQDLAGRFGALDGRESEHYRDVSEALTGLGTSVDELRGTVSCHVQVLASLDGISGKLTELAGAIGPLLPPEPGPLYYPAPAVRWWARIDSLASELAGNDQPGEGFLAKAGRLGEARHRAEQIVLPEDILLAPEPGADQDEESPRQDPPWGLELLAAEDPEE